VALFLGPLFGSLGDRYGLWRVLFIGAVLQIFLWPLLAVMPGLTSFGVAYALVNGIGSGVFAISFSVLSNSTTADVRGRVMSFAFLPVNIGVMIGPAIGAIVTRQSVFAAFPTVALLTAIGLALLVFAYRKQAAGVK
jgi:MFS family permease